MQPTPFTGAETLHPNSKQNTVPEVQYSEAEKQFILFKRQRLIASRDVRDAVNDKFDGMGFLKWYELMERADDQFIAPRKNKQDTSINLGTIRDKDTSLVEYAMKYDWEIIAQVYNQDDEMMEELAETGEDLVRKSKQMENYKDKLKLTVRSMVSFGTALVEDTFVERWVLEKTMKQGYQTGMGSTQAEWTEKLVKKYDGCQAKLWDLRQCYFGDIRKFFMNGTDGQPYFFTVEYSPYDTTKSVFGNWDRWESVPTTVVQSSEIAAATQYAASWSLRPITSNYCEIIRYFDPIANEFAISINGVDMLPIMSKKVIEKGIEKTYISGFPLTKVSPSGAIPVAKYDNEPVHNFAYSKPTPAKMRVLADTENMIWKLMIGMFKQKAKPTLGNKSGRQFGEEVTDPGTVINDIRDGDLFPILPDFQGIGASETSMFELVKKELDKNSIERSFQGTDPSAADTTATKEMNDLKAQSLKVASMFDGIISGENQLNWLRTFNIMANWTKPIDVRVDSLNKTLIESYRSVTVPTEVDGGQKVKKVIRFTKGTPVRPNGKPTLEDSQRLHQEEINYSKENGGEVRLVDLHPEQFAQMKTLWYYTCVPIPNDSDPLGYFMFAKQIQDAIMSFGAESLNAKRLKHRFAKKTGMDFDTWFLSEKEMQQKQDAMQQTQPGQPGAAQPGQVPGKPVGGAPTIAGAAGGANPVLKIGATIR